MKRPLARCLQSLSMQTLVPDEVIIVDDGSTDGSKEWWERMKGTYSIPCTYISQIHAGASAARNRGFSASQGEYVMFLDADVVMKKHALQRLFETIQQAQDDNNGYAYSSFKWGWKKFPSFPFDAERLTHMPYIHTTSLIKCTLLPEAPFDTTLKRLQDWDLYLTLWERGITGVYIPEYLFMVEPRGTMSQWLPSIIHQIPFSKFGIKIPSLEKYREAEMHVRAKHHLLY